MGFFQTSGILNRRGFFGNKLSEFTPKDINGIQLWLKSDLGWGTKTIYPDPYISQIVISGSGSSTSDGTYTRSSGGATQFDSESGNYIYYNGDYNLQDGAWNINDGSIGNSYYNTNLAENGWQIADGDSPAPSATNSTTTPSSYSVNAWLDQSGNQNDFIYGGGTIDSESNSQNGLSGLAFDGGYLLSEAPFFSIPYNQDFTLIAVSKATDSTVFSNSNPVRYLMNIGKNGNFGAGFTFGAYDTTSPNFDGEVTVHGVKDYDIETASISGTQIGINYLTNDNTNIEYYLNNTSQGGMNIVNEGFDGSTSNLGWSIGCQEYNGTIYYTGTFKLYEIIMYNSALSSEDKAKIHNYLNTKWAVY